jgi:hypothetical protein
MTTLSSRPLLLVATIIAMMGGLTQGCGRTSLLASEAPKFAATDAAVSTVSPTGGATSRPTTNGACSDGFTACGRGAASRCYDLTGSPDHCGQCGNACSPGIACQSSKCQQYQCKGALTFKALPEISTILAGDPFDKTVQETYSFYRPALGDFDGDGILDFVGLPGISAPIGVLLGRGDGTFQARPIASAFVTAWTAAVADLNGDGWQDLATMASDQSQVTVRLGNGDPATLFAAPTGYPTPLVPDSGGASFNLLLADLDDDGHVDMVASGLDADADGKRHLILWRGSVSGVLADFGRIPVGSSGAFLAAADSNRDGVLDLLFGSSTLRMVLGRDDGTFDDEIACGIALGDGNVIADFDHDQKLDLVVGGLGIFLGMNGCNFTTLVSIQSGSGVGVADLNGDGNPDIVYGSAPQISVLLGDGHGGFASPLSFPSAGGQSGGAFLVGDLNHDSKLDIIVTRPDGWQVLLNTCP